MNPPVIVRGVHSVTELPVEIVERKGIGHPDSMCDGIVEELSRLLSKHYVEEFGTILHYNVDKAVLAGGRVEVTFGSGRLLEPIYILIVGRATTEVIENGRVRRVPIGSLVMNAVYGRIERNFRFLKREHVVIDYKIRPGSADLVGMYESSKEVPLSNDTSIGVGFRPFSPTEKVVYEIEQMLNDKSFKEKYPAVGEDIKVMGVRIKDKLKITVAMATIAQFVNSLDEYVALKEKIREIILDKFSSEVPYKLEVHVNTADVLEKGLAYLTITGTSAEHGDDGQVGRGNRVNGLITPYRPMSLEAAAGKNPVSHVGKIYNVVANDIAKRIYEETNAKEVNIRMVSQIGKPINEPQAIDVGIVGSADEAKINRIVQEELEKLPEIRKRFLEEYIYVF